MRPRIVSAGLVGAALVFGAMSPVAVLGQRSEAPRVQRWSPSTEAADARARFALHVDRLRVPLRLLAVPVLPGATVAITRDGTAGGRLLATAAGGRLRSTGPNGWEWTAPRRPGFHAVRIDAPEVDDSIHLTFVVLRPATEVRNGELNGYAIGAYRPRPASMSVAYEPPRGFIEARPEDYDILVSPNFRLEQFLCKQPGDPRYLLASPLLLMKLEAVLRAVNEAGYSTPGLTIMSGFRTPAYNRAIGNTTDFSRHLWGDAADIFIDTDGNGDMDDLDGNGVSDLGDARWLAGVVDRLMAREGRVPTPGGMSVYRRNAVRGPFVHIDSRGHRARW